MTPQKFQAKQSRAVTRLYGSRDKEAKDARALEEFVTGVRMVGRSLAVNVAAATERSSTLSKRTGGS